MGRVRFRFDPEKFADAMAFLASRVPDLTTLKAAKLLYLADRYHLLRYGRPILGDTYICMDYGPVPSAAYDLMKDLRDPDRGWRLPNAKLVEAHVRVKSPGRYEPFVPTRPRQVLDALSGTETDALQHTVSKYGRWSARRLVQETHEHATWKKCRESGERELDYGSFFDDHPSASEIRKLMEEGQENRDFVEALRRVG